MPASTSNSSPPSSSMKGSTTTATGKGVVPEDYLDETIRPQNLPEFPCNEEIVIAGMAGKVAGCHNVAEFDEALFGMKDLLTTTEEAGRYENGLFGNQSKMGAIPDADKFDAGFFNMYPYMANSSDPMVRLVLERVYEAIVDAGESLESFKGTKTSVIVGALPSDSPESALTQKRINNYSYIGYVPCHISNRISYSFDLHGPSFTIDSACSSSLAAMETAVNHIRMGYSDNAIVASTNLVQNPYSTLTATHVGMLCSSGYCKAFDKDGDGFVRADGAFAVVLRKRSQAKRIYGTIMHLRGNNDGFTKEGVSVPSGESQSRVVQSVYKDLGIDPNIVKYAECHGPGTQVGDGVEVDALAKHLCSSRKDPLYIGSVKSNIAHPEGAAGLASVMKCLISLNNKKIAPNLNFKTPNPNIASLHDGRVKVVTKPIPLETGLISCSSFGVGGTNYNLCLRAYKNENRAPHPASNQPRLFVYGCRTKEAAAAMLEEVRKFRNNVEYHALLEPSSLQPTSRMPFRFYDVLNAKNGNLSGVQKQSFKKRPVWLSFSGMGTQWKGMGRTMMALDIFRESMERSAAVLKSRYNLDLLDAIYNCTDSSFDLPEMTFVGITSIGLALYDLIAAMGIEWDNCFGHSLGETAAAYADGCITQEEAIICSYWRGRSTREVDMPPGKMLAVGMDWEEAKAVLPENCWLACHNYQKNVTISGLEGPADKLCADLTAQGYFAREINTLGKAFHCPCTRPLVPVLRKELGHLVKTRTKTPRFLSTSIPQDKWDQPESQSIGLEYFINNLVNPVLYYEVAKLIPENAVVIEVSPNAIFYGTLKKTVPGNVTVLSCMKGDQENNVEYFLNQMGMAYTNGVNMETLKLYQPVQFPVPKGTPYTSPVANKMWDHSASYFLPKVEDDRNAMRGNDCLWEPDLTKTSDMYLKSYVVNGKNIYPPGGYILMAWKTIAHLNKKPFEEMAVVLEDVVFLDNRTLKPDGETTFTCSMQSNGAFEIRESKQPLVRGFIHPANDKEDSFVWPTVASRDLDKERLVWAKDEIYDVLATQGRTLDVDFQNVIRASHDFSTSEIHWDKEWEVRLESILQCAVLHTHGIDTPGKVDAIHTVHIRPLQDAVDISYKQVCAVKIDQVTNTLVSGNVVMQHVQCKADELPTEPTSCCIGKKVFVTLDHTDEPNTKIQGLAFNGSNKILERLSKQDVGAKLMLATSDLKSLPMRIPECLKLFESLAYSIDPQLTLYNLENQSLLESCLDVVTVNTSMASKLSVLELDAGVNGVYSQMASIMATMFPKVAMTYTLADGQQDMKEEAEHQGMTFENWSLQASLDKAPNSKYNLIVAKSAFSQISDIDEVLSKIDALLFPQGFVLVQEAMKDSPMFDALNKLRSKSGYRCDDFGRFFHTDKTLMGAFDKHGFEVILRRSDSTLHNVYLLRKTRPNTEVGDHIFVDVSDQNGSLQKALSKITAGDEKSRIWIHTDILSNGMLGLMRSLQKEAGAAAANLRCVIRGGSGSGKSPSSGLSEKSPDFQRLVKRDLVINELRDGAWGFESTIRLDSDKDIKSISTTSAYIDITKPGDFSSLTFLLTTPTTTPSDRISVYYATIDPRGAKSAMGQLEMNNAEKSVLSFGTEFVGRKTNGDRFMGIALETAMATEISADKVAMSMPVPSSMSMKDASGLLYNYSAALYTLNMMGRAKPGHTVMVTSGETALGQALISVALRYGLKVFAMAATEDGRNDIIKQFPQIPRSHVCLARDSTVVQNCLGETKGKGVDTVVYPMSCDTDVPNLLRLVAKGGYFIHGAGTLDSIAGHTDSGNLLKGKNILEVDMSDVMRSSDMQEERKTLMGLVQAGMKEGFIRPLQTSVFALKDMEKAFREATNLSTCGQVSLEFRQEESSPNAVPLPLQVKAVPKTVCHPDLSYILIGGLQSLGLEMGRWLVQRGCRNLLLVDSAGSGINCAYQRNRVDVLGKMGAAVTTWTKGANSEKEINALLAAAKSMGPVGGIVFLPQNIPAIPFKDMTPDSWTSRPTIDQLTTVRLLDAATRNPASAIGKDLHLFCAFTTLTGSCLQADGALRNHSNSLLERMMTKRRNEMLPGQVIQLGSVADVKVAGNQAPSVPGTHPQNMINLVQNLDEILNSAHAVTSCYVLPALQADGGKTVEGTPVQLAIAMELGVPDLSNYDQSATLMDLGMDSIVGNQAVDMLESKFRITIDAKELTMLTVEQLGQLG